MYKSFIRPHLDYSNNLEKIQYNSALTTTGAIKGTSKEKRYPELELESVEKRRWYLLFL